MGDTRTELHVNFGFSDHSYDSTSAAPARKFLVGYNDYYRAVAHVAMEPSASVTEQDIHTIVQTAVEQGTAHGLDLFEVTYLGELAAETI